MYKIIAGELGIYLSFRIGGKDALPLMRNSALTPSTTAAQRQYLLLTLLVMTLRSLLIDAQQ